MAKIILTQEIVDNAQTFSSFNDGADGEADRLVPRLRFDGFRTEGDHVEDVLFSEKFCDPTRIFGDILRQTNFEAATIKQRLNLNLDRLLDPPCCRAGRRRNGK